MNSEMPLRSASESEKGFGKLILEVLSGPMDGTRFKIEKKVVEIGRDQHKDIQLPLDSLVSRSHARISSKDKKFWLEDLGSTNGTYLMGEKVEAKVELHVESIFRVGASEMRLTKGVA